ncbi:MAG: hypothetical protein MRY83_15740 [Flavobacteriales bacterium]|nr:hypothetical protein [Flavobacteriales bacterium]
MAKYAESKLWVQVIGSKESHDKLKSLEKEFKSESDRALAILGASAIDHSLGELLERTLIKVSKNQEKLLTSDGPLSSFSSRIEICYRLGIISIKLRNSLHLIRKIRNDFAHNIVSHKLSGKGTSDKIMTLFKDMPLIASNYKSQKREISERNILITYFSSLIIIFENTLLLKPPFKVNDDFLFGSNPSTQDNSL